MPDQGGTGRRVIGGRYRLDRFIGRGGMGVLWAGEDTRLGRPVAVKQVIPPEHLTPGERDQIARRALREARAAARTSHPSAITVYDVVEQDGCPWIVMQLLTPWSLADVVSDTGPLTPPAAARIGIDLLDAIVAADRAGVLHRDVKPGNVLFRDGRAVLVDFGIAAIDDTGTLSGEGEVLGSPAFLPPERARGEPPTLASDLWSLGATLYAVVEGRSPFQRGNALATLAAVLTEDPPAAAHAGPLAPVIDALLAADPLDRPDADEVRSLLATVAGASSVDPADLFVRTTRGLRPPIRSVEVTSRVAAPWPVSGHRERRRALVLLAALALVVCGAAGSFALLGRPASQHLGTAAEPASPAIATPRPSPGTAAPRHSGTSPSGGPRQHAPAGGSGTRSTGTADPGAPTRAESGRAPAPATDASARTRGARNGHGAGGDRGGDGQGGQGDQGNQGNRDGQGGQGN